MFSTKVSATLTVDNLSASFDVTTLAADLTPDPFSFASQLDVAINAPTTSNAITITGINSVVTVSAQNGTFSVNGGPYIEVGEARSGDVIKLRQVSSAQFSTKSTTRLTVGTVSANFDVTTLAADTTPDAFSFTPQTGVALTSATTSNTVVVSGINTNTPISIVGGQYRINSGAFTSATGQVKNGDSVTVQQTSAAQPNTKTTATLSIGGVAGGFDVTTLQAITTPGAPTIGTATAGNAQASVTFTAPVSNGGSAITGYTVTSSPGGLTATGTASPITVSGLTNGTAYTFTVRATNSVGTGPASAASNSVTPAAVVNAPVLVTTTLPNGVRGTAYASHLIIASTLPLTSASATGLPPGLTAVHNGSGVLTITGTPTEAGIFTLNVAATDNAGGTLATTVSLSIIADDPNTNVTALAGGGTHSCAVVDGGVQCWGWNGYGQLGDGSTTNSATPVQVSGLTSGVTAVATGDLHSCAVVNGGVRCWGYNLYGQLGNGSSGFQSMTNPTPVQVSGLPSGSGVSAVAGGHYHSCAVVNGGVRCWGGNQFGEIGNGSTTQSTTPAQVTGLTSGVTAVATGVHTCAVVNGGVQCWGLNASGQLGNGSTANSSVPAQVTGLTSGVTSLATGNSHSCAVVNGGVRCWGYNYDGELGNGSNTDSSVPVQVTGLTSGATVVAGGDKHGCAVVNGSVQCWGSNSFAQLGNGSYTDSNVPVQVSGLTSGVTTLAAGSWHSCAAVNGSVQCWGSNASGEFGNGNTNGNTTPTQVTGLTSGVTTVAGGYSHSCAVVNGGAQCWGSNDYGSLGNGSTTNSATPVQVTALTSGVGVMAMATGGGHSCAVVNGGVRCWGANNSGQLGNGSNTDSHVPVQVSGLASGVTAVATGMYHSCAVVNGGVRCWGSNGYGRLGNGSTTSSNVPVQVAGLTIGVTAVAVGDSHSCAVVNGGVQCWGRNGGRLGNGSTTSSTTPVQVTGLTSGVGVTAVAAGYGHSCAVVSGGVQCWGSGAYGRLGDGSTAGSITPVQVIGLTSGTGATAVATGDFHSCAVVNGGVQCWGRNGGRLGNGSTTSSTTPVQVSGLTSGVTAVAVGNDHSCAVVNSAPVCWGYNGSGQLGNAASGPRTTPQRSLLFRRQTVPGVPTIGMTTGGNAHARLAPHPSLSQPSGNINGQVVVNSYSGKTGSFQENLSPSGLVMP
jgi:alpha-tubulin suppressor-like RCC1 family protein